MLALVAGAVIVLESQAPRRHVKNMGETPVVVELFTSQGCSSCPPADELLHRIAADPKLRGKVIPLAYHVDYWNHLGWRDPFSSHDWSERQGEYVRAMKLSSAYTPQVVVNGSRQMVGSNASALYGAIAEELRRKPAGDVRVSIERSQAVVHAQAAGAGLELVIVTFENGAAATRVARGENGGRTLTNDAIVRTLTRVSAPAGRAVEKRVALGGGNGAAAFLQEVGTRRIVSAAAK